MDRYLVAGNPVEHSQSPFIHAEFARLTGEPLVYDRRLIPLDGFGDSMAALAAEGVRGCNVTVPFKFQAYPLVNRPSARSRLAEACNVLRFDPDGWSGDNTDGIGLVRDIEANAGVALYGRRVLLIGAGGAAAGALGPLLEARPAELVVANRTPANAAALVDRHRAVAAASGTELRAAALEHCGPAWDVVVNASSSSLQGAPIPIPAEALADGALVLDMMYGPPARRFLEWAEAHGARPRDGLGMLVEQAAAAFEFWRGLCPPTAPVLAALRGRPGNR